MFDIDFGEKPLDNLIKDLGVTNAYSKNLYKATDFIKSLSGNLPGFAARAGETLDLEAINIIAGPIRETFTDVIIFGTGGSSLGGQAATDIAHYKNSGPSPVLHFPDSLDPFEMDYLFKKLDQHKTHIIAISKSGTTAETLAQVLTALSWLKETAAPEGLSKHFTFLTEPGDRPLRSLAEKLGAPVIDHPLDVGGRFSVLTAVGMLPAAIAGQDVSAFRKGAADALQDIQSNPAGSHAVTGAALMQCLATERYVTQVCLMPYADSLRAFTRWFAQLWAESLGKDGKGTTPLVAVGPVDQHSQLQLYLDGPNDKVFTLITVPSFGKGPLVDAQEAALYGLDYMAGNTIGDTVTCQAKATAQTLRIKGRVVRNITIDRLDDYNLGSLFMHFMIETITVAHLMGINAFDQPAVEQGKILTRQYLSEL